MFVRTIHLEFLLLSSPPLQIQYAYKFVISCIISVMNSVFLY